MRGMALFRPLFGLCLALILALTSVTMAQHYGPIGRTMVICGNGMAQTVTLDGQGHKVPLTHTCPDCNLVALHPPIAQYLPQRPNLGRAIFLGMQAVGRVQIPRFHADARGPPVLM